MGKGLTLIAAIAGIFCAGMAHADNGWEATILVGAGNSEYKLALGMAGDARDGIEGRHDVPALFTEENAFRAYLSLEGMPYWRDVKDDCSRETCVKTWDIVGESAAEGATVRLVWDPGSFPKRSGVSLTDAVTGARMDMKERTSYSFVEGGKRLLRVEVTRGR